MERLTRLGTVIAAFFACFLAAGTGVAATGEQLCRQLEAELAAASSVGDAPPYGNTTRQWPSNTRSCGRRIAGPRCRLWVFAVEIRPWPLRLAQCHDPRMERNLEALWSKRTELAETSNAPTVRARLLASLEGNGCRDGTEPPLQVLPPMEDAGLNPSPLEQMLDDGTEQQDIPEEHILRDPRRRDRSRPIERTRHVRRRSGALRPALPRQHHHAGRRLDVSPDEAASARRAQGQGRRASVPSRPRRGNRSASSGPEESPVRATLNGMNNALPLRPVFSLT